MRSLVVFCLLFLVQLGNSQTIDFSKSFKNLKARSIGPAGMSGRVTAIDAVHSNPDIIFIGAASGGVWKTTNGGSSWLPVFDEQPTQNIGAIAVQQSNPSIVWVGTGEGNPRNSVNIGQGIYKSLDGGKSWKLMGLEKTFNIHRIIVDPTNPNIVYVGAIGNPYGVHKERGLYRTIDGGSSWTQILYTNDSSGVADMVMDPQNPNKLLVCMWQHHRNPWSFKSGGPGSGLYLTWDGGNSWKKLGKTEGLPDTTGRIGLAIAPSDPEVIYAMIEATKNGLYRSEDGGRNWKLVNSEPQWVTNRPFYFQDIAVDPSNENRLYNIYQMIAQSDDGGKSFRVIVPYSGVHPDHHAWWIHPKDPSFIINGNDGGIAVSHDRGRTWQFDEKLPLGQFYHVNVDNAVPYNIMGGLQDNGSWHGPAYVWAEGGIRNFFWKGVGGGDGFDVMPDPTDAKWVYSMSQGGYLNRQQIETGETWLIRPPGPDANTRVRFNWNAALAQDPFDKSTIYYGSQFVHKSVDKGNSWSIISPDLTTNNAEKQRQDENGGLTIDITNAENHCTILAIEPSSKEPGTIWVGTDDGQIQLTRNGGNSWTNLTANIPGFPKNGWVQQIRASRYQAGEAWVVANNYRQGDFATYLFRTRDFGKTWNNVTANKATIKGYALCFIQDPVEPNLQFLGTENGLWISLDNGNSFIPFKNNYPSVSTYDLAIQERENDLVIGSFGRAIYVIDDYSPLRKLAGSKSSLPSRLTLYPVATAYQNFTASPSGIEWSSSGVYAAENRPEGACIQFYAPIDTAKLASDSVMVKIYDTQGNSIRSFTTKSDTGFNRIYWDFSTRGVRKPGSAKPRKEASEPRSSIKAPPETYKIVVSKGKQVDSTYIDVKFDPRSSFNASVYLAQKLMMDRLKKSTERLTAATDRLSEMEEIIKKIDTGIKEDESMAADSLRKQGKALSDSIKIYREKIIGKKQEKQGYGSPYEITPYSRIETAGAAVSGKRSMPGAQEERLVTYAEQAAEVYLQTFNQFVNSTWNSYRLKAAAYPSKMFSDWKNL